MEHFEELIEMQEGSNDGVEDTPQGEKTAQPGEILDIEEVNVSFSIKKFIRKKNIKNRSFGKIFLTYPQTIV